MTRPNVLIHHMGTRGGGPKLQAAIGAAMQQHGADVSYSIDCASEVALAIADTGSPTLRLGAFGRRAGRLRLPLRLLAQLPDSVRLVVFARRRKVDLVYEPMGHPLQILPRFIARILGVPFLTSVHDAVRHAGEEDRLLSWLARFETSNSDGVVVYSSSVASQISKAGVPVIETVHGAFGSRREESRTLPEGPVRVGFFGRIEAYKGIPRLVWSIGELRRRGRSIDALIVGRGELDEALTGACDDLGIGVDARWVPEPEIERVIGRFDVLALPYDEASQSGVVGFALSAGVPIVATPVGGLEEQVRQAGGIVARDLEYASFADALDGLIQSPDAYAAVSSEQIRSASTTFGWDRVAFDILDGIERVLARVAARRAR